MADRILITGGTGKTGRRIVENLRQRGIEPRIASRAATGLVLADFVVPVNSMPQIVNQYTKKQYFEPVNSEKRPLMVN